MSRRAYGALLAALDGCTPGEMVTADTWRDRADKLGLSSVDVAHAHRQAIRDGYLVPFSMRLPNGGRLTVAAPSATASRKGGRVLVYSRTSKALPERPAPEADIRAEREECEGQLDILSAIGPTG